MAGSHVAEGRNRRLWTLAGRRYSGRADDDAAYAGPAGRVGDPAAVDQHPHAGQVGGGQRRGTRRGRPARSPRSTGSPLVRRQAQRASARRRCTSGRTRTAPAPRRAQRLDGREDAGERGLLHPAAVGRAEHQHRRRRSGRRTAAASRSTAYAGIAGVGLAGRADHGRVRVVPQVDPRVDRDAVPADRDARLVDVAVRLGVAGLDDLVDVDADACRRTGRTGWPARCSRRGRWSRRAWPARPPRRSRGPTRRWAGPGRRARRSRAPPRRTRRRAAADAASTPPTSFGYRRRSAKTRPVSTRSGLNTRWKSRAGGQAGALLQHRRPAVAGGADRQRGLVADQRARAAGRAAMARVADVHPAEVRHARRRRRTAAPRPRRPRTRRPPRWCRWSPTSSPASTACLQLDVQVGLAGERLGAVVDQVDDRARRRRRRSPCGPWPRTARPAAGRSCRARRRRSSWVASSLARSVLEAQSAREAGRATRRGVTGLTITQPARAWWSWSAGSGAGRLHLGAVSGPVPAAVRRRCSRDVGARPHRRLGRPAERPRRAAGPGPARPRTGPVRPGCCRRRA